MDKWVSGLVGRELPSIHCLFFFALSVIPVYVSVFVELGIVVAVECACLEGYERVCVNMYVVWMASQ